MPAKMRMQPKALKCSCVQIRCEFCQSCLTHQRRTGSNCTIEVSRVDWDGYRYIYIQTRSYNAARLLASLYSSAIKAVEHCNVFQPEPVAEQGPYDIVTSCLCLEYVCQNTEDYREGIAKLARFLKPGGTLLMQSDKSRCLDCTDNLNVIYIYIDVLCLWLYGKLHV